MAVTSRTRHSVRSFLWVPRTCSLLKQREAAWVQFMKNRHARYEQHQKFFSKRAIGPSGSNLSTSKNKIAPTNPIVNEYNKSQYMCAQAFEAVLDFRFDQPSHRDPLSAREKVCSNSTRAAT